MLRHALALTGFLALTLAACGSSNPPPLVSADTPTPSATAAPTATASPTGTPSATPTPPCLVPPTPSPSCGEPFAYSCLFGPGCTFLGCFCSTPTPSPTNLQTGTATPTPTRTLKPGCTPSPIHTFEARGGRCSNATPCPSDTVFGLDLFCLPADQRVTYRFGWCYPYGVPCSNSADCPPNFVCTADAACGRQPCQSDKDCNTGYCVDSFCYQELGICGVYPP